MYKISYVYISIYSGLYNTITIIVMFIRPNIGPTNHIEIQCDNKKKTINKNKTTEGLISLIQLLYFLL